MFGGMEEEEKFTDKDDFHQKDSRVGEVEGEEEMSRPDTENLTDARSTLHAASRNRGRGKASRLSLSRSKTSSSKLKSSSSYSEMSSASSASETRLSTETPPSAAPIVSPPKQTTASSPSKQTATSSSSSSSTLKVRSPAKAGDSKFLSEFYSHSRLHHISTWGAEFRAYVCKLQKEGSGHYPGRDRLRVFHEERVEAAGGVGGGGGSVREGGVESLKRGKLARVIMHVDMDCFFVSVGLLSHPELKGQ